MAWPMRMSGAWRDGGGHGEVGGGNRRRLGGEVGARGRGRGWWSTRGGGQAREDGDDGPDQRKEARAEQRRGGARGGEGIEPGEVGEAG